MRHASAIRKRNLDDEDRGTRARRLDARFAAQHRRRAQTAPQPLGRTPTPAGADAVRLPIAPQQHSPWTWACWSLIPELADYEFIGDPGAREVLYGGVRIRPGDLIVGDQTSPLSGLFTGMCDEPSLAAHVAVVVMLEKDGRYFPAALECFKYGVRAVPLSLYLSETFTAYAEVLRLSAAPADWPARLERAALEILDGPSGYDFFAFDRDQRDERESKLRLTCTTLASTLFRMTGVEPVAAGSRYHAGIARNLRRVGVRPGVFLTPSDFLDSPRFELMGTFDHGRLASHVTRALVVRELRDILCCERFDAARMPLRHKARAWAIRQIQSETLVGQAILGLSGFSRENFPDGPAEIMALVGELERLALPMIEACEPVVERRVNGLDSFSYLELARDPAVLAQLSRAAEPARSWLVRRRAASAAVATA